MSQVRAELQISGQVQGVWFRQSAKQTALKYDVCGWVCNRPDGSVAVVLEGERTAVQAVIDWCHHGPEMARVDDLQIDWKNPTGEFDRFQVR